jgi:thymidylate synthase (FAD)
MPTEFVTLMDQFKTISEIKIEPILHMGGDFMVAAAAKVSTTGIAAVNLKNDEKGLRGLINYLMEHRHGTPFEHSAMTFFVHAPIFVWREWHRHRIGFSYNEESGRYKQLEPTFYLPEMSRPMMRVDDWKPGRPKFDTIKNEAIFKHFCKLKEQNYRVCYESYEWALQAGFDPGLARIDLPVGIYSSCWVTCNPRSLMAFLSLRTHDPEALKVSYPLYEIEVAARVVEEFLHDGWPITYEAFVKHGRLGP